MWELPYMGINYIKDSIGKGGNHFRYEKYIKSRLKMVEQLFKQIEN
jgi:hypothetical protein